MLSNGIAALLAGSLFTLLGLLMCRHYRWRRPAGYLPLIAGIALIYMATVGPLSDGPELLHRLHVLRGDELSSVTVTRLPEAPHAGPESARFTEPAQLELLCRALNSVHTEGDQYLKGTPPGYEVALQLRQGAPIRLGMRRRDGATRLDLNSAGTSGWHYTALEAVRFGAVADSLLRSTVSKFVRP